jgi:hypothetical protein
MKMNADPDPGYTLKTNIVSKSNNNDKVLMKIKSQ